MDDNGVENDDTLTTDWGGRPRGTKEGAIQVTNEPVAGTLCQRGGENKRLTLYNVQ